MRYAAEATQSFGERYSGLVTPCDSESIIIMDQDKSGEIEFEEFKALLS